MCPAEINPGGMPRSQTRPSLPSSRPLERRKRAKGDFHRQSDHSYSKLKCSDNPNALEVNELDFAASAGRFKSWVPRLRRRREPRHTALIAAYCPDWAGKDRGNSRQPRFQSNQGGRPEKANSRLGLLSARATFWRPQIFQILRPRLQSTPKQPECVPDFAARLAS